MTLHVEPVQHHDLVPDPHEIRHEPALAIAAGIGIGDVAQLRVRPEDEIVARGLELRLPALAVLEGEGRPGRVGLLPDQIRVGQVPEEVRRQHADPVGEDAPVRPVVVGVEGAQAAGQHHPFRRGQRQQVGLVEEHLLRRQTLRHLPEPVIDVVAEAVHDGLQPLEHLDVGQVLRGIDPAGRERHLRLDPGVPSRFLHGDAAGEHDEVGQRDLLAVAAPNRSALSAALALPAGTGGTPPATDASFGTPAPGSIVLRVGTEAQLTAAIDQANAGTTPGPLAIEFTNDITLMGANDLPVLQGSSPVTILGQGHTLDGNDFVRGLMVLGGNAAIEDLTIADTVASGGMGGIGASGGGGGAGLGGGLMVAGGANVLLADVHFSNDAAQGGEGGISGAYGEGYGGGGGLGGSGGNTASSLVGLSGGGGGIGAQAVGGNGIDAATGSQGTAGPITGAPSDAGIGAHGSVAGGGGDGGSAIWQGGAGAGGGIYGLSGADTSEGGEGSTGGWGGGGGGNNTYGGNGGFGGGGGGSQTQGGYGGFGGGGGGGAPLLSGTGAPGGFGGGAGGDGTNNPQSDGGGGGLGAGGAVFVEQGSSLTVVNSGSTGDTVAGGQGQNGGGDGQAYGAGWFIQGNQAITLGALSGQTTTINDVISDETGSHDASGATGAGTVIAAGPGTVALEV